MKPRKITFKIFIITSLLLVSSALIIYLAFYFLLPEYYQHYKKKTLEGEVQNLVKQLQQTTWDQAEVLLNNFAQKYNVFPLILDFHGQIKYYPYKEIQVIKRAAPDESRLPEQKLESFKPKNFPFSTTEQNIKIYSVSDTVQFRGDDQIYHLTVDTTLQPVDEAADVILMFLPYMILVILLISALGAYIYSKLIAKPLIAINNHAKKMAQLDFSVIPTFKTTKDEIGELGDSLNDLAYNLQHTMNELQQANTQLKDDIEKEREQEIKRREFVATISHELKTPITAVSGQLEAMINNIGVFSDRDKYLRQSYHIMKDMEKLVHEILDITRLESDGFKLQIEEVDLSKVTTDILVNFKYFLETKDIELVKEIDPKISIEGDERFISKAISNVINNAITYSKDGEEVYVQLKNDREHVKLVILNSGASIDENDLKNIFNPFFRIEKSRSRMTGGSGLGLFIVKKILDSHNADYKIENLPNGVQFTIKFPRLHN